jgi:hypothetical protein
MIILFYSNQCKFSEKLLEYIKKNNLEKYFKMINIDDDIKIPDNITIVPTIIDETIEAPLEGKDAFIYVVNQKFFNHPTNNIDFWVNKTVPKPVIDEDKKAIEKHNFGFASIETTTVNTNSGNNLIDTAESIENKKIITDKKILALLKLKR